MLNKYLVAFVMPFHITIPEQMDGFFVVFVRCYQFYLQFIGLIPCTIKFRELRVKPSRFLVVYGKLVTLIFIFSQAALFRAIAIVTVSRDWHMLNNLLLAIMYLLVMIITYFIYIHTALTQNRFVQLVQNTLDLTKQVQKFKLNSRKFRHSLFVSFIVRCLFYEIITTLVLLTANMDLEEVYWPGVALRGNLTVVNIFSALYFGAMSVMQYNFRIISVHLEKTKNHVEKTISNHKNQMTFMFSDNIDEIASLHKMARKLCIDLNRFFEPLLCIIFLYHWCNFTIQAFLFYMVFIWNGDHSRAVVLSFVSLILNDFLTICSICTKANSVSNESAEAGLILQKFNEFVLDCRLENCVS